MKKRNVLLIVLCVAILLGGWLVISVEQSAHSLTVSAYDVPVPGLTEPIRVLHLSDLHNAVFGEGNRELLAQVRAQAPDLIFLTGDLVNQAKEGHAVAAELIGKLTEIAPVYASLGNHELEYEARSGVDLSQVYRDAGATVLERDFWDLEVKGQEIRLGGIYGYCLAEQYLDANPAESEFLREFQRTDRPTLLLCHNPTTWLINGSLDAWDVDCVFAGHTHGGQIVLPLLGGVYGPDLGWFPGRLEGLYHGSGGAKTLVLSRGLGSSVPIPRVNNIPQIVVANLIPEKE